jgi:hypothetical protein
MGIFHANTRATSPDPDRWIEALGVVQFGGGAFLAAVVDSRIETTVTPMIVGAFAFGVLGLGSLARATGARADGPRRMMSDVVVARAVE